jgi:hypothetical protein
LGTLAEIARETGSESSAIARLTFARSLVLVLVVGLLFIACCLPLLLLFVFDAVWCTGDDITLMYQFDVAYA